MSNKIDTDCERCGLCCLTAPCFEIPIREERFFEIEGTKVHFCRYLSFENEIASCLLLAQRNHKTGICSSSRKYDKARLTKAWRDVRDQG